MNRKTLLAAMAVTSVLALPAFAHHPGADLDRLMGSEEKYFQAIDAPAAPGFDLADDEGNPVRLSDFADKVVVLNFVFASCTDVCPLHSDLIARVQAMVNETPMKDVVQFLTVTTDPKSDTPEVMKGYGEAHGLDPRNWTFLTTREGQAEDATRKLSEQIQRPFRSARRRPADAWLGDARDRPRRALRGQVPRPQVRSAEPGHVRQWADEQRESAVIN
ncbi:SCO family protein [Mesorhizobium sp.]|uniref:SCO family protein n=1 Tax=Mesorhizobium sp. TaxID=1871066 RepID=UPI002580098E|nr:SCO family protein [Mesorhizobium sp.]